MAMMDDNEMVARYSLGTAATADKLNLGQEIAYGAVAAVADFGVTLANSITLGKADVHTEDLLSRMDKDVLQVYNENEEAVHAASFIGGVFVPAGLAMKGMSLARAGSKSVNWFSEAGKASNLAKVEESFAVMSKGSSAAYDASKTILYKNMALNAVADNVAAEFAILTTMNAHPYMEDYMKDLPSNFLIGAAFGTGIQSVIGGIQTRGAIRNIASSIQEETNKILNKDILYAHEGMNLGDQLLVRQNNIQKWEDALAKHASDAPEDAGFTLKPYTVGVLEYAIQREKAAQISTFEAAASAELKALSTDEKMMGVVGSLIDTMTKDLRFSKMDSIEFAKVSDTSTAMADKEGFLQGVQDFVKTVTTKKGVSKTVSSKATYLPEFDSFVSAREADDFLSIADLGKHIDSFVSTDKNLGKMPRKDMGFDLQTLSTAEVEGDFATMLLSFKNKTIEELNSLVIDPDDLPQLRAVFARVSSLSPEDQAKFSITLTKKAPSWEAQTAAALKNSGANPQLLKSIKNLDENRAKFQLYDDKRGFLETEAPMSSNTRVMLRDWVAGYKNGFRRAAVGLIHPETYKGGVDAERAALLEISNHPRSVALRNELAKISDAEGNVYLYRGIDTTPKGHMTVESYSFNAGKAEAFGKARLYKVHVDDILGSVEDMGPIGYSNSEILVLNKFATRENIPVEELAKLTDSTETLKVAELSVAEKSGKFNLEDFSQAITDAEMSLTSTLTNAGYAPESIAKRIGVTTESFNSIASGNFVGFSPKFSTEEAVIAALGQEKRAIVVGTNMNKIHYSQIRSNLNEATNAQASLELTQKYISTSPSELVQQVGTLLGTSEARLLSEELMAGISKVTSEGLINTFFSSANRSLEKYGITGTIAVNFGKDVTHLGNIITDKLIKPINQAASKIINNEALVVEHNMAVTVNASLRGKRLYNRETGQFMQEARDALTGEVLKNEAGEVIMKIAQYKGRDFTISSPDVRALFEAYDDAGKELYAFNNTYNKIVGKNPLTDLGFWMPAANPRGKEIAYVLSPEGTSVLYAKTAAELGDMITSYEKQALADGRHVTVVSKDKGQEYFNKLKGREEAEFMQMADVTMQHSGASASALLSTSSESIGEILNSYDHYIAKGLTNLVEVQLSPVMESLKMASDLSQRLHNEKSVGTIRKLVTAQADPGMVMKNVILGKGNLSEYTTWAEWQDRTQAFTDATLEKLGTITAPFLKGDKSGRTEESFAKLNADLEAAGLTPFKAIDDFRRYQAEGHITTSNLTKRGIALSNAVAATTLLKFMEVAQPLVNMMSLPILTSGAMRREMATKMFGATLDPNAKFGTLETMMNGVRLMNHPTESEKWMKIFTEKNLLEPVVHEANQMGMHLRSLDKGLIAKGEAMVEKVSESILSRPADLSEILVRKTTLFTGIHMAKKAYPGISDVGALTFARSFMDEAVGNFSSAQRPVVFQGTFGVAMGLFQTYMLTLAQQLYRGIERKDWVGLSKQMFAQATIFGGASLPGFHVVSEQIGNHFSDNNVDLQTGTFRALGDDAASLVLYGLPSSFGPGFVTRGDIQPRVPNPLSDGFSSLAAYNLSKQAWEAGTNLVKAATAADGNTGLAFMEALSAQSVSRPIARISELVTGRSVTSHGDVIASPSEVYTTTGIMARLMSTRPTEEIKSREAIHLDSVYKSFDSDKRAAVVERLKKHIRNGDLSAETIQNLQYEYLRTGNPTGWRAAYRKALDQSVMSGDRSVKEKLKSNAPYQIMVDDLD